MQCDSDIPRRVLGAWQETGKSRELRRDLTEGERALVAGRSAALEAALRPHSSSDVAGIEAQLAAMFSGFRALRQNTEEAAAMVRITRHVLRDFPAWAISRACMRVARGQAGLNRNFAPNDAELHAVVADVVKPFRDRQRAARALLDATVEAA